MVRATTADVVKSGAQHNGFYTSGFKQFYRALDFSDVFGRVTITHESQPAKNVMRAKG
jgi:hypothetical protein